MGLLHRVWRLRSNQDLLEAAGRVAAESQTLVWQLLQSHVGQVHSVPEAQAFVRARVRRVVRHQMYRAMDRRYWSAVERDEVILNQALSILAQQYANRLLRPVPSAMPLRRAA